MKKIICAVLCSCLLCLGALSALAQTSSAGEPAVKIIKLNFASVTEVATVLTQLTGPQGKVIANEEAGSVVLMDTPERIKAMEGVIAQMDIQTVTIRVPLKFSRADEVLDRVRGLLTRSVGLISADMKENVITVTDMPAVVERVRRAVETLDPRGRKVMLEAKLVHVVLDDEHLDGVDWGGIVADHQNFKLESPRAFLRGKGKGESLSLGTIEGADFVPLVEALDTVGIVKEYPVLSVPAMSDSKIRMVVRLDDPDLDLEPVLPDTEEAAVAEGAVVEFFLQPQVDVDGGLKTVITERDLPGGAGKARNTMLNRKPRSATVRSLEGGSIVIGGLIATEQVLTQRRIPLIGDLPLLGFAFRYHNSSVRREEFVVLLTPKLVPTEALAVEPSRGGD